MDAVSGDLTGANGETMNTAPLNSRVPRPENGPESMESKSDPQQTTLNSCLDALLYESGELRPLTHNFLKLLEKTKMVVGNTDALFLDGISHYLRRAFPSALRCLSEAEEKGCKHPILYYFMGECYNSEEKGLDKNSTKALDYYNKAIEGGCTWAYRGRHLLYKNGCDKVQIDNGKALISLLDLEREGKADGCVLLAIASCYHEGVGCCKDLSMATRYYQRAIDLGYPPAYISDFYWGTTFGKPEERDKVLLGLLEAEHKGIGVKDGRIIAKILEHLKDRKYTPNAEVLGKFNNKGEMALHYCDVLIERGIPHGYYMKGALYKFGEATVPDDESKAVSIWEEADRLGLANVIIYCHGLAPAYRHGDGVPANGLKVFEWCEKALQLDLKEADMVRTFEHMASVYAEGIEPVSQDGNKVLECYERVLPFLTSSFAKADVYDHMAEVYWEGIPPIAINPDKAREIRSRTYLDYD